jgi:hypothetical protein
MKSKSDADLPPQGEWSITLFSVIALAASIGANVLLGIARILAHRGLPGPVSKAQLLLNISLPLGCASLPVGLIVFLGKRRVRDLASFVLAVVWFLCYTRMTKTAFSN